MEAKIVFDGTAKRNEINKSLLWANGRIYKLIDMDYRVLVAFGDHRDFKFCPFEKVSDIWGITIYTTIDPAIFVFELA